MPRYMSGTCEPGVLVLTKQLMRVVLLIAFLSVPVHAVSGEGYTVYLVNGNSLTANSYAVEGDSIYVRFPVGEAAFSLSEVASIKDGSGKDMLFQEKGVYQPPSAEELAELPANTDYGCADGTPNVRAHITRANPGFGGDFSADGPPAQRKWSRAYYSPRVEEIDSFIDRAFEAADQGREISDEEVDRAFAAFFDEGYEDMAGEDGEW